MVNNDQSLFGVYVGLVLETQDPDNLARVKLIVPGKTGPLFEGWNDQIDDISFTSVTSKPFSEDVLDRLISVLPWARPSMPLWGGGTGSPVNSDTSTPQPIPTDASFTGSSGKLGGNGRLDKNNKAQLVPVRGVPGALLNPTVENKFQELVAAAKKDGVNLAITDSYRSYDEQVDVKQRKGGLAATPGTSKHGYGLAIDFTGGSGTSQAKAYEWLKNNASNYGWSNFVGLKGPDTRGAGGSQKEPWHWQINETDLPKYENKADALANANATPGTSTDNPTGKTDTRTVADDGLNNKNGNFGPAKNMGSGNCSGSTGRPLSRSESKAISSRLNKEMDSKNLSIAVKNGIMDEASFKAWAVERLKNSPLLCADLDQNRAHDYKMPNTNTPEAWADFIWRTNGFERKFQGQISSVNDPDKYRDPGGSHGPWSTSVNDTSEYAGYSGKTVNDLDTNPMLAANTVISLMERQITLNNSIDGLDNGLTKRGSFASTTMAALRGERGVPNVAKSGSLIQRITNLGQNLMGSLNIGRAGAPIGSFSIPAAGSKVWVAFEGGNPQRPVYIGQVYEPSNIQAME